MDTGLLTIDNIFTPTIGAGPVPSTPTQNTSQLTDTPSADSTTPAETTDNNLTNNQSTPANRNPQGFHDTLQEKIRDEAPRNTQDTPELKEQDPTDQTNPIQPTGPQDTTTDQQNKTTTTEIPAEPQTEEKPTQSEGGPLSGTANENVSEPQIALSNVSKILSLSATVAKPAENKTTLNQTAPKTIPPDTSTGSLNTSTGNEEGKNTEKIPASNKLLTATNDLTNQKNSKDSMPDALIAAGKTTSAGEKTEITDTPAPTNQKTSTLTTNELTLEATTEPTPTAKPVVPDGQKPALNAVSHPPEGTLRTTDNALPAVQDKSSGSQSIASQIGHETLTFVTEKPANNKTDVSSNSATGATANQILSESSAGKQQQQQGDSLSGEAILQKLNPAQVQVSTNQTKDHTGSTANNNSNPDFNQILSQNNTQIPVTEQTSVSSQTVKTADNALPGNTPPTISEQILASIHGSLRQGDQQITIHLNPPELGKVFIKFDQQQNQITGLLEVSKAQTRVEIQQALPQIIQTLADSGIQIKRIEVVLTDQSDQNAYKDQSLQDGPPDQHGFTDGANPENSLTNPPGSRPTGNSSYQSSPEQQQMFITESSINMLI